MMAPGFKPVGWVAAVAGAALGCYMLSLNVAAERAELTRIERRIIETKQEIRLLQTELGTRGRMAQLEHWNAEVLALSAPASNQFLDSEMKLARFDQRAPTIDERVQLHMAAAETQDAMRTVEAPVRAVAAETAPALGGQPLVRRASLDMASLAPVDAVKPVHAAPAKLEPATAKPTAAKPVQAVTTAKAVKPAPKPQSAPARQPELVAAKTAKPPARIQLAAAKPIEPVKAAKPAKRIAEKRIGEQLAREINAAARNEAASERR